MSPGVRGAIYGIAAAAIWGGMYVVSDEVLKVIPPFTLLLMRLVIGLAILGWDWQAVSPLVGTVLLGLGIGAEVDLLSFLITRYFGVRAFGALHGLGLCHACLPDKSGTA